MRAQHFGASHVAAADVVQVAVVGLADQRIDGPHLLVAGQRQHVVEQGVGHARHVERGGERDRRLDLAQFVDLRGAGQLAEGVADEDRAGHLFAEQIAGMRQDRRDAGANIVAANQRGVADADAGHVGDGVERPARQRAGWNADFGRAGAPRRLLRNCGKRQQEIHGEFS